LAKERKLLDACGQFMCFLSKHEALSLQNSGTVRKIGKISYRLDTPPSPSNSDAAPSVLTGGNRFKGDGGDIHVLAGMHFSGSRVKTVQRERVLGWLATPRVVCDVAMMDSAIVESAMAAAPCGSL
jgi:hypothetical protein